MSLFYIPNNTVLGNDHDFMDYIIAYSRVEPGDLVSHADEGELRRNGCPEWVISELREFKNEMKWDLDERRVRLWRQDWS